MAPDFTKCAASYLGNATAISLYGYHGATRGVSPNPAHQISYKGCLELCGPGAQYYDWDQISDTILTWVLPTLGVILQAPFESNEFGATLFSLIRWIGSPMTSMAYSLWNIRIISRASMLVDLATRCDERIPDPETDFSSIRDSFYLLTVMNQFTTRPDRYLKREAEGLLRIVLFSKELPLVGNTSTLNGLRTDTARLVRELRRRGVVPTFISTLWFFFSLAVSIQDAFGTVGENAEAHDLALGFLLAWIPVLIMFSAVDRDFGSATEVCRSLNYLVDTVIDSLRDPSVRKQYASGFVGADKQRMAAWVETISEQCHDDRLKDFFEEFAGQARMRYHYGVAHPILTGIERSYIAEHGRGWLADEREARYSLVLGRVDEGLVWFDWAEVYDIFYAVLIVSGTILGGFTLSYFTPTEGFSCRSGGYTIFWVIAVSLLILELFCFWLITPAKALRTDVEKISHVNTRTDALQNRARAFAETLFSPIPRAFTGIELAWHRFVKVRLHTALGAHAEELERMENRLQASIRRRTEWRVSDWTHFCLFRPLEGANAIWLVYIVAAQTIGSYNTCECQSSTWGIGGGYIDFSDFQAADAGWIIQNWTASTVISMTFMGVPMIWVVVEWCLSSNLVTSNYDKARAGLRLCRQFRRLGAPWRALRRLLFHFTSVVHRRKVVRTKALWSYHVTYKAYGRDAGEHVQDVVGLTRELFVEGDGP